MIAKNCMYVTKTHKCRQKLVYILNKKLIFYDSNNLQKRVQIILTCNKQEKLNSFTAQIIYPYDFFYKILPVDTCMPKKRKTVKNIHKLFITNFIG